MLPERPSVSTPQNPQMRLGFDLHGHGHELLPNDWLTFRPFERKRVVAHTEDGVVIVIQIGGEG